MKRILVPTDFSEHAFAAGRIAVGLARRKGAEVTLMHGLHLIEAASAPASVRAAYEDAELGRAGKQLTEMRRALLDVAGGAVDINTVVREGDPSSAILAYAGEYGADLIAMGSRGLESDDRLQFGSVAQKITRGARCPVLVTRSGQAERIPSDGLFRAPMVAVDYSKFSLPAAELAAAISEVGAAVEMLHVYYAPDLGEHENMAEYLGEARAEEIVKLEQFAKNIDLTPLSVKVRTEVGRIAASLISFARGSKTDVIILGAHGRDHSAELIGSVADRVIRVSPAPVIIIPEKSLP